MSAGELVKLTCARHFFQHVGEVGRAVDRIAELLRLDDKLGVFDFIQCAGPVRQLHPGLERRITLAWRRGLPLAAEPVQTLHGKRLAADAPCRWHGRQRGLAGYRTLQRNRGHHVDQGVHAGPFFGRRQRELLRRKGIAVHARLDAAGPCTLVRLRWRSLPRRHFARGPGTMRHHCRQYKPTGNRQTDLQRAHADPQARHRVSSRPPEGAGVGLKRLHAALMTTRPFPPMKQQRPCRPPRFATHPVPAS